jgi:hypothetical protein
MHINNNNSIEATNRELDRRENLIKRIKNSSILTQKDKGLTVLTVRPLILLFITNPEITERGLDLIQSLIVKLKRINRISNSRRILEKAC